ncbi:MAG: 16S rRNA (guanine(527)-N(7))-methyltransferase RsmG [Clostridiales bacterium]|nr:16S rRNA (guanine(527)-N(7))-methyltransferase RsmG [Clostridiales bacterium]
MNEKKIRAALERNGIPFPEELPEKLNTYFVLLQEWNSKIDLTAVTDEDEMLDKHFIDSLTVLKAGLIQNNASLIDVGTGAGFPGLVLAMARPDLQVTLLDSQQKRLLFLEKTAEATGTENITVIHARAEDGARKPQLRERFDYAAARALAPANVLCEYLLPYVKVDGYALCWKGPALRDELESGRRAAHLLGGRLEMPVSCPVAGREWEHTILPIRKVQHTASTYPRKAGTPKSKPLGL